ncbi:band 7 protein AGAP004871-like isoform X2 [Tigriopus californicus]|uniref:band 7 protein AGAP004871-like isoform X2 n=1 Tax=Tigriopus californicus TaxID=6832 RepID=UPI0027DAB400|nr:band 7 protein AGAP004871-like isoform X2 [Tigriopus californicus]
MQPHQLEGGKNPHQGQDPQYQQQHHHQQQQHQPQHQHYPIQPRQIQHAPPPSFIIQADEGHIPVTLPVNVISNPVTSQAGPPPIPVMPPAGGGVVYQPPSPSFTPPPPIVAVDSPSNGNRSGPRHRPKASRPSLADEAKEAVLGGISQTKKYFQQHSNQQRQSLLVTESKQNGMHNGSISGNVGVIGADESDNGIGLCGWLLTAISWGLVIVTLPFSLCVCFKVVQEYERAVIFRLGRLLSGGSRGPGIFFIMPCVDNYTKVDLRTTVIDIPPQEVLTKDSVTVSVDAVVYYRVSNATVSVANVENAHHSTRLLAQTTLRNILGTKNLHEILSDRESISGSMQTVLDEATTAWGIKVERVEIKDARLPVQLQRAMAAEAEAAREARAKVIAAEGEQKASQALKEASIIISESSSALQLRYLQTLNSISAEKNSTIIFPLPIDFISHFLKDKGSDNKKKD